jgi:probable rRNA maturation factor
MDSVPKRTAVPTVLVSDRQSSPLPDGLARSLAGMASDTLAGEGRGAVELSLSFVDPGEMAELHDRYMGEPGPTDVLSFPMEDEALLGDVVVCPQVAGGNNPDRDAELRLLVVHGTLHILGYDHEEEDERAVMWAKQEGYSGVSSP